jgi:hypothetical protein
MLSCIEIFTDVIKDVHTKSFWVSFRWVLYPMTVILKRSRDSRGGGRLEGIETQGRQPQEDGGRIGMMLPQARKGQEQFEGEQGKKGVFPKCGSVNRLGLDFWLPEQEENTFLMVLLTWLW